MRIKHVKIRNWRSIRNLDIDVGPLMIFVGPNNCGKSNVLTALNFFFSSSEKAEDADRCSAAAPDEDVSVELTFCELTEQDRTTFRQYILPDGLLKVVKLCHADGGDRKVEYHGYRWVPRQEWLNPDNAGEYASKEKLTSIEHEHCSILERYFPSSGKISKSMVEEFQQRFVEDHPDQLNFDLLLERGPFLGRQSVAAGILGHWYLIPAVRDVSDEMKLASTTAYGKLLGNVIHEMREHNKGFQAIMQRIEDAVALLNRGPDQTDYARPEELVELERTLRDELQAWDVDVDIHLSPPDVERLFQQYATIFVDDGVRTALELKGHGLQRWMIFGLIRAWASTLSKIRAREREETASDIRPRAPTDSIFIAFEEPELFLHPQAQRKMLESLKTLAAEPHHQVLICTHSSFFVDMDLHRSICILQKDDAKVGTTARQCVTELFHGEEAGDKKRRFNMAYWFNPDRSEMFFGRKTVLVEGPTEKALFPFLGQRLNVFDHDITIVDCGGKHNLRLYMEVLNAFRIGYLVVHDIDPVTVSPGDTQYQSQLERFRENERIAQTCNLALGAIQTFDPDIEKVAGISKSQGDRLGKPVAALEKFAPSEIELPQRLEEVIRQVFAR